MNPYIHAKISAKRWQGKIEDYYQLHRFIDSTKEICSDNRHRILHTHWAIHRVITPIFGHVFINSDGKQVNVKDLCERDHILPDYRNRFIPTLADFSMCIREEEIPDWRQRMEALHQVYADQPKLVKLLLSPLSVTGQLKSLLFTHNSWFLNEIVPQIFPIPLALREFELGLNEVFAAMDFQLWMDNGASFPPSARKIEAIKTI